MNRRAFLAAAAAALAYDPERALWVPGAKTISVPAPRELRQYGPISMYGPWTSYDVIWEIDAVLIPNGPPVIVRPRIVNVRTIPRC
jgi:hypothetical protein